MAGNHGVDGCQDAPRPATWTLDKYPDAKTLKAHSKVVLLDVKGPGVVTAFHVSDQSGCDAGKLMLRVWYDAEPQPAIEMPLMDFLGNIEAKAKPFSTIYFSRVRRSHNFRLPLPFREGIRIEVENPTDRNAFGYLETQWDEVQAIPAESGYLRVAYRNGTFKFPHEELVLCDIASAGTIVAHWLQLDGDHPSCAQGQGTCEGNHELYLDGESQPSYESLGAEDFYGHSWGFGGLESDFYSAIVRYEPTPRGGSLVAMILRGTRTGSRSGSRAGCCSPTSTTWASLTTTRQEKASAGAPTVCRWSESGGAVSELHLLLREEPKVPTMKQTLLVLLAAALVAATLDAQPPMAPPAKLPTTPAEVAVLIRTADEARLWHEQLGQCRSQAANDRNLAVHSLRHGAFKKAGGWDDPAHKAMTAKVADFDAQMRAKRDAAAAADQGGRSG